MSSHADCSRAILTMIQSYHGKKCIFSDCLAVVPGGCWLVCACLDVFFRTEHCCATYTCEDQQSQNACSHDFEVIFEPKNVVLVSGFLLGYG